jgi:glucokinase
MVKYAIGLDLGGTNIRGALIGNDKSLVPGSFISLPIDCNGPKDEVFGNIFNLINSIVKKFSFLDIAGVGIGTCGRIDPKNGIFSDALKYRAFKGLKIKDEFYQRLPRREMILEIEGDTNTFVLGEMWQSPLSNKRVFGITIGSGIGVAFYDNGKILKNGKGIPPNGAIWGTPLWDPRWIIPKLGEQPVRKGGIMFIYKSLGLLCGKRTNVEVKDIAERASQGEKKAILTFKICDWVLGLMLNSWIKKFNPEVIVFGGQISKSFILFNKHVLKLSEKYGIEMYVSKGIDLSPLFGAARLIFSSM